MNETLAFQEPLREELIGGKVVAMSPRPAYNHNRVASLIYHLFENYLEGKPCTPIADGTDLYLSETDRFIPDMMVVCDRNKIQWNGVHGAPDLVVEVLSHSTAVRDRGYKKDLYEASGIPEYWIVSPTDRSVEVYLLTNSRFTLDEIYMLPPAEMEEERDKFKTQLKCHLYDDLVLPLEDIFADLI